MINSIISGNNLKQVMNCLIFLGIVLTSANVLAATRDLPVYKTMQVNDKECNVTVYQASGSCKAVKRKSSTNKEPSNSMPGSARRVFIDDFERVLLPVTKFKQREVVWISE